MIGLASWEIELLEVHGPPAAAVLDLVRPLAARLAESEARLADLGAFLLADPAAGAALRTLHDEPRVALLFMRLAGVSRYAFEFACRVPGVFWQVVEEGQHAQVWGRRMLSEDLEAEISQARDDRARQQAMVRFKHHHWLRVIMGDACGLLRFESVVAELSDCTDALAQMAVRLACDQVRSRGVIPAFSVLGMGKHGGRELNYSSDLDLIFVYEAAAETDKDEAHAQAKRIGELVIRWLEGAGSEQLFRVDMRLRPEGDRGELALSFRETLDYYWSAGRPWERQAMLKARPIAGDLEVGQRLLDELQTWIYPIDPRWEDMEESRMMRRRIEERAEVANVKTGAGGIRDIEFLAQHFQLLHGGRIHELRLRSTIPALRALADRAILPRKDAQELEEHLIFLRTVEHRLQCWEDRQEHLIPNGAEQRTSLAHRCGFFGDAALATFEVQLSMARGRVRDLASQHFLQRTPDDDAALALLIQGEADERLAGKVLAAAGFKDLAAAARHWRDLAAEPFFILSRARTERALLGILPGLLHQVARSPDPDVTIANFGRIVSAVGGRAVFYDLLAQRPQALQLYVEISGNSNLLVELFVANAGLPDEVADALARLTLRPISLHGEARGLIRGLADPGVALAYFRARELAVVASRDLLGSADIDVPERLTVLAEVLVASLLQRLISDRAKSWGIPEDSGRPTRFCILALGKLGGRELSYGSDFDVIFICEPGGICPRNGRDGEEFWTKIAQDVSRTMQEAGLGEIDARLRPYGDQSELVTSMPALDRYWSEPREMWERMAHVRAAYLAGDPNLADDALAILHRQAIAAPRPADWAEQVRTMRARLETSVHGEDNVKRGHGGYVDAEFVAQALTLGRPLTELPRPPSTAACLRGLADHGVIGTDALSDLLNGLRTLRGIENRLRLVDGRPVSALPTDAVERGHLARRCGQSDVLAFDAMVNMARAKLTKRFDELMGSGG